MRSIGGRRARYAFLPPALPNISLDHTDMLGDTLQAIAAEKAGIIKPHTPVVIGETDEATANIFREKAYEQNSKIVFADQKYKDRHLPKKHFIGMMMFMFSMMVTAMLFLG